MNDLLDQVLNAPPAAYALLHRPASAGPDSLDVLVGEVSLPLTLAQIPVPAPAVSPVSPAGSADGRAARHETLVVVPYRQISERGFSCADDGSPLIAMSVTGHQTVRVRDALDRLPHTSTTLTDGGFDLDDDAYAQTVRRLVDEVIGAGAGANFVVKRTFTADIGHYTPHSALAFFRRLLERESGAYWTFLIHTGTRTLVGASPERHVSLRDGVASMNPVSGTYRYPPGGPTLPGVLAFLADRKEADELSMVVDEELKMMTRICDGDAQVRGPYLKEMARLAHTEYLIEGRTAREVRDILRETMFAPTVTGSPLESACRVIAAYEPQGRGYYAGFAALIGRDEKGARTLDSAILIRTADVDSGGRVRIDVGATLVRHSDPDSEAAETRAKAAGLLSALTDPGPGRAEHPEATDAPEAPGALAPSRRRSFAAHPAVRAVLERRNDTVSGFWLRTSEERQLPRPELAGRTALVVDAEDAFTAMIDCQLRSLGLAVTVRRFDQEYTLDGYDVVVMGPGPGDPSERGHPRMDRLRSAVRTLLDRRLPFVAVCLSHQILSLQLGFPLERRDVPNQGVQKEIDLFGRRERVGFYNAFAARSPDDKAEIDGVGVVEVCRDPRTGEIHALRGPRFASLQFHAESLLTQDGPGIVARTVREALGPDAHRAGPNDHRSDRYDRNDRTEGTIHV
ncbi:anthranilate synthase family protein [Streptomyces sp. NPDC051907]|uniref:anthranilate synthase family protein n=1 Tax=Streptomyces sp. NPDC051907 TaxID=3155284 RepID=UPI00343F133F